MILVKAAPMPSKTHVETVYCAGVTADRTWRRLFPVRFRQLSDTSQFNRWQWVEYCYGPPRDDTRRESRRILEPTIAPGAMMPPGRRYAFLASLILDGLAAAEARGDSLALVRPAASRFYWRRRTAAAMEQMREAYRRCARQDAFFDVSVRPDPP